MDFELRPAGRYVPAMPIYEFYCGECRKESEVLVRSTKWEGTPCPHCGSKKLSKKLSVFASNMGGGADPMPACGMGSSGACCGCAAGRPHRH
ncbi:MAG: zinc ribbon domain-containing protein [Verrucomicrobia bacterium]|nr:zinc ribbon domain-containing protein [Verrucomicrobiota bacterium]